MKRGRQRHARHKTLQMAARTHDSESMRRTMKWWQHHVEGRRMEKLADRAHVHSGNKRGFAWFQDGLRIAQRSAARSQIANHHYARCVQRKLFRVWRLAFLSWTRILANVATRRLRGLNSLLHQVLLAWTAVTRNRLAVKRRGQVLSLARQQRGIEKHYAQWQRLHRRARALENLVLGLGYARQQSVLRQIIESWDFWAFARGQCSRAGHQVSRDVTARLVHSSWRSWKHVFQHRVQRSLAARTRLELHACRSAVARLADEARFKKAMQHALDASTLGVMRRFCRRWHGGVLRSTQSRERQLAADQQKRRVGFSQAFRVWGVRVQRRIETGGSMPC